MMKPVYISSASAISPQQNFESDGFLKDVKTSDDGMLFISEPNYRKYINPVAIRRMSKLLKMGISTGMNALEKAGVEKPDAIITGTGRGSMADMEQFLTSMIDLKEEALTPTSFIQSTYNSVNGWLALQTKSNGYNQTYVHRGTSLELALLDAQMMLNETEEKQHILAGCFDEITPDYVKVKGKIGYWKEPSPNSADLYKNSNSSGTIAGEGSAFFTLSNDNTNALCTLESVNTLQDASNKEILAAIHDTLQSSGISISDIDVVLMGMNGDVSQQPTYSEVEKHLSPNTSTSAFKHLCGEYDTSSGFALWAAVNMLANNHIPQALLQHTGTHEDIENVLIVNHYILNSTSIMLLRSIQ